MVRYWKYAVLMLLASTFFKINAQSDSAIYENGLPVADDDTVRNFPAYDLYPKNSELTLSKEELPHRLVKALNNDELYKGWDKLPVVYNKRTGIYSIRVIHTNDTAYYGFNDHGKPVSYGKRGRDDQ